MYNGKMRVKHETYETDPRKLRPKMTHIYLDVPKYQEFVRNLPDSGHKMQRYPNPIGLNEMCLAAAKSTKVGIEYALIAYEAFKEFYDISGREMYYDRKTRYWSDLKRLAHEGTLGRLIRRLKRVFGLRR